MPVASLMVPPLSVSSFRSRKIPSSSLSFPSTAYWNLSALAPVPQVYSACFCSSGRPPPMRRVSWGEPVTATSWSKVTVAVTVSPMAQVRSSPGSEVSSTEDIPGSATICVAALVALSSLPPESVKLTSTLICLPTSSVVSVQAAAVAPLMSASAPSSTRIHW